MEAKMAAITASLNESRALLASCARRLGIKEQEWQEATKASVATMPGSLFAPHPVRDQPETKPSSPSFISTHLVLAAGALHEEAVVTPTMPTRCSTLGVNVNGGSNHTAPVSLSWGNTEAALLAPLEHSQDKPLRSYVDLKFSMLTPNPCSVQCFHDNTGLQKFAFMPASSPGSSPCPFLLDGAEDSPMPSVAAVPVGVKISAVTPLMTDTMADEVFTDVGGVSLFLELELDSVDELFNDTCLKDVRWDDDIGDSVLTHVGGISLFLECDLDLSVASVGGVSLFFEQPLNSLEKPGSAAASGVQLWYLILPPQMVNSSNLLTLPWDPGTQGDATHDPIFLLPNGTTSVKRLSPWDPGKQDVIYIDLNEYIRLVSLVKWRRTIRGDSLGKARGGLSPCLQLIFHGKVTIGVIRHLFPSMCHLIDITRPWDPGGCPCSAICLEPTSGNALVCNQWQDTEWPKLDEFANIFSAALDFTREYSIKHVIADPTFLAMTESICYEKFRPPVVVLLNNGIQIMKIHSPTTAVAIYCKTYLDPPTGSKRKENAYNGATYWSGAVQLPLCLKLAMLATLSMDTLQTWNRMVFSTVYQCWPLGSSDKERNNMSWHLQVQEESCKWSNFCSLIRVSNKVEYKHKQWDPGISQKDMVCFLKKYQQIRATRLQGGSEYVYAAFRPCRSPRAIAWGQAMFLRGGNVMTGHMDALGLVALGHGLALRMMHGVHNGKSCTGNGIDELKKEQNQLCSLLLSLCCSPSVPEFRRSISLTSPIIAARGRGVTQATYSPQANASRSRRTSTELLFVLPLCLAVLWAVTQVLCLDSPCCEPLL